jgi:hypothetical protein
MSMQEIISTNIDFGTYFMGKKETQEYYLSNNTPNTIEFKSLIMLG